MFLPTVRHCHWQFEWAVTVSVFVFASVSVSVSVAVHHRFGKDKLWGWVQVAPAKTPVTPTAQISATLAAVFAPWKWNCDARQSREFAAGAVVVSATGVAEMPYSWPWPWPWPVVCAAPCILYSIPYSVFRISYFGAGADTQCTYTRFGEIRKRGHMMSMTLCRLTPHFNAGTLNADLLPDCVRIK